MIQDPTLQGRLGPLARTIETVIPEDELLKKLERGGPLRCKFGIDPTSPTVHIGNGIPLFNLRRLQDLGHQAVLILGDYTATVGDPSGKDKTRPMLTSERIEAHLATWVDQLSLILDMDKVEMRRNSEWFSTMSFLEVLSLTDRMTVQQMMERDSFETRWEENDPISVREFIYCLMQGWDSVMVRADVELGGTDQTFNLNVGRRLMAQEGLEPQVSLISPLLEGTDGHAKMSKSLGNAIGVSDPARDQFGMVMRIADEQIDKYARLATDLSDETIQGFAGMNPRDAKLTVAAAVVGRYHDPDAGAREREEFLRVFSRHDAPSDIPEMDAGPRGDDGLWWVVGVLKACNFAKSTSEARRLVEGGGVHLDEERVVDWQARLALEGGEVLRVGRRRYARLRI